ncbi:MAG: type II secretion system protein [Patescibacteria group bacterium]
MKVHKLQGFTLIELLIVIALIAVLAGAVIIALNPARQFQLARNSERWSHVSAIVGAVTSNTTENKGVWTCPGQMILATSSTISSAGLNIYDCLVPSQMASLPVDPNATGAHFTSAADYNTGYSISKDASNRITVWATGEAGVGAISVTQ